MIKDLNKLEFTSEHDAKLAMLESAFNARGLSIENERVKQFFTTERRICKSGIIKDETMYVYSDRIRPTSVWVYPFNFENCGYGKEEINCLLDWLFYNNASSNPLVFENLNNYSRDILESFVETRKKSGPIKCDINGKIFNGADGNHRLLLLILHEFMEYESAKTTAEKAKVREKYGMRLDASFMHNYKVADEIENRFQMLSSNSVESPYNLATRFYKEQTCKGNAETAYCADYNNATGKYKYNFNGLSYEGDEKGLLKFFGTHPIDQNIMQWSVGDTHYVAYGSRICKTATKNKIADLILQLTSKPKVDNAYTEIKDVDADEYEIFVPAVEVGYNNPNIESVANLYTDLCKVYAEKSMFTKCSLTYMDMLNACETATKYNGNLYIPERHYTHLTKIEFAKISDNLADEFVSLNNAKSPISLN